MARPLVLVLALWAAGVESVQVERVGAVTMPHPTLGSGPPTCPPREVEFADYCEPSWARRGIPPAPLVSRPDTVGDAVGTLMRRLRGGLGLHKVHLLAHAHHAVREIRGLVDSPFYLYLLLSSFVYAIGTALVAL